MKLFMWASVLLLCLGCGGSTTGPEGLEQDELAKYVAKNPNMDDSRSVGTEEPDAR